jgi:hypothetical protein
MDDGVSGLGHFQLTVQFDSDGIDWTHFRSRMGHTLTPHELPIQLWKRLKGIVNQLHRMNVRRLVLVPSRLPQYQMNDVWQELPPIRGRNVQETMELTAWWMEWKNRQSVTHDGNWNCTDCDSIVESERGHCDNPECESWNVLFHITGNHILHLVPKTGS